MSKNVTVGDKQLVIKPALLVLIGAVTAGVLGPLYAKRLAAQPSLVWKCSNLDLWKFEVRRQARAELATAEGKPQVLTSTSKSAAYNLDMARGVEVTIQQNDGAADCVDLRNAINFEEIKNLNNLQVKFSARAEQPHEILLILRESENLRWSSRTTLTKDWSEHSLPISFDGCRSNQAIFSIHLGGATGKIGLKDLRIEQKKL